MFYKFHQTFKSSIQIMKTKRRIIVGKGENNEYVCIYPNIFQNSCMNLGDYIIICK